MKDILRILVGIVVVLATVCVGVLGVILAAIVGVILHLALFAAPFIMVVVIAIRDWWVYRASQKK